MNKILSVFMDASELDQDWIAFIEAEIKAGSTYEEAKIEFDIACGER